MTESTVHLVVEVRREQTLDAGLWVWTGLPKEHPGSAGGRTVPELWQEIEALKHFMVDVGPETEISVEYVYEVPGVTDEGVAAPAMVEEVPNTAEFRGL